MLRGCSMAWMRLTVSPASGEGDHGWWACDAVRTCASIGVTLPFLLVFLVVAREGTICGVPPRLLVPDYCLRDRGVQPRRDLRPGHPRENLPAQIVSLYRVFPD